MDAYELGKRFSEILRADRDKGMLSPLADYQAIYPGHDDLIAAEYAAVVAEPGASPDGGVDLEMLTAQHHHRYATLGELARGGMGAIFHIRDETLRRDLAMKMVLGDGGKIDSSSGGSQSPLARRFLEEAQITAQLDHPGVVPVHELGADQEGRLFFTMKLVKGRTLGEIFSLSRAGHPDWTRNRVLGVLIRVLETLAFAHEKGVIHRDLKPPNVMVGDFGEVYVMDWGLAKVVGSDRPEEPVVKTERMLDSIDPALTGVGQVLGTLAYMPPEQAEGAGIDGRADLYAVGAMLYEYLTGHHPYGENGKPGTANEFLLRLLTESPRPPEELVPETSPELAAITNQAMARAREGRYATALEFAEDIRRFVEGKAVQAHATGAWIELRKWVGRNRALATAIAASFLLLAAGFVVSLLFAREADFERTAALRQTYRVQIAAALAELAGHDNLAVKVRLDSTRPELRGWEYEYLRSRLDESVFATGGSSMAFCAETGRFRFIDGDGVVVEWDPDSGARRVVRKTGVASEPRELGLGARGVVDTGVERIARSYVPVVEPWLSEDGSMAVGVLEDPDSEAHLVLSAEDLDGRFRDFRIRVPRGFIESPMWGDVQGTASFQQTHWRLPFIAYSQGECMAVRDARTGEEVVLPADAGLVRKIDPERQRLVSTLGVWDIAANRAITPVLRGHEDVTLAGAFTPDGRRVITGSVDRTVRIWDAVTGRPTAWEVSPEQTGAVLSVAVSPDGRWIASGGMDRTIRLLDVATGQTRRILHGHFSPVTSAAFSPDGRFIGSATATGEVRMWSTGEKAESVLRGHVLYLYAVEFSPDGSRIYSGSWDAYAADSGKQDTDRSMKVWDSATGELIAGFGGEGRCIFSIAVTPDGLEVLTCGGEREQGWQSGPIRIWDAETGEQKRTIPGEFRALCLSLDGRRVAAITGYRVTTIFDRVTGAEVATIGEAGTWAELPGSAWSPDGRLLAAVDRDGDSFSTWDTATWKRERRFEGHGGEIWSLDFSPDGRRVVSASGDDSARVWEAATGEELAKLTGHGDDVLTARFSPDGARILTGSRDQSVRMWDSVAYEEIIRLPGHESYVIDVAMSNRGGLIATASGDKTLRLWDTTSAAERYRRKIERRKLVEELTPRIKAMFAELGEARAVVDALRADRGLTGRRREVALQVALAHATTAGE